MLVQNMMMFCSMAQYKLRQLFTDEKGEVNIVAIVVLIGIAVLLALIFKEEIGDLLETLFETIEGTATDAINPDAAGAGE